jgi:D-alanyl-lipoteichoic acid acyltransferase DltB (MBOAT superfamily)
MYAFQIYADFSGYTDIALGIARLFNIELTQNFRSPYLATSVTDFWRRWHISFSRWILDYIFRPLQVSWRRFKMAGTVAALLITFLFSGLWHGISANFVVWGLLHGVFLAVTLVLAPHFRKWLGPQPGSWSRYAGIFVTFHLVCFAWIFFRANSLTDAIYISSHIFSGVGGYAGALIANHRELLHHKELWDPILLGKTLPPFVVLTLAMLVFILGSFLRSRIQLSRRPVLLRFAAYYSLIAAIALLASFDNVGFVYFQF